MKNTLALAVVTAFVVGCATAPADTVPPAPPADESKSCFAHLQQLAKPDPPEAGVSRAWAVVHFELDGSGSPSAVRISSSSGSTAFDTSVVRSYALAKYAPGVKRSCTERLTVEPRKG